MSHPGGNTLTRAGCAARPLDGLFVVDASDERGELCGRLLADLGAEVVRLEPPGGGASRRAPPFAPQSGASLAFALRNSDKRGATLALGTPTGRALLDRLLAGADVFVESYPYDEVARLELEPERLLAAHPRLVVTSVSDFGRSGPHARYTGTNLTGFAVGGMMYRSGAAAKPPVLAPGRFAYDSAGTHAALATMLALWQRLRTGRGQHIDVSVQESVSNFSDWSLPQFSVTGQIGHRMGAGIYPLFPCADGHVRAIILVKHHWQAMLEWMGRPESLLDPALDTLLGRLVNQKKIDEALKQFFADKKKIDIAVEAQRRGIPVTPLLRPGEVLANEHTAARGTFVELEVAPGESAQFPSGYFEIDGERVGPRERAPAPGEHNRELWIERVGLSEPELDALRAQGVI
jgi:crotonobetainyl-CoA:carnitine CoA-transferase CaiB-like acyl-CoA transferase